VTDNEIKNAADEDDDDKPGTSTDGIVQIWKALIAAFAAILVGVLGYYGATRDKSKGADSGFEYTGHVKNKLGTAIANATVKISEDQSVPQMVATDSEGVFNIRVSQKTQRLELDVIATGYQEYTRIVPPSRSGAEIITLEPLTQNSPDGLLRRSKIAKGESDTLFSNGTVSILYEDLGDDVRVSVQTPQSVTPMIDVDVNGNAVVDAGLDIYYGTDTTGKPCNGYMYTAITDSACGVRATRATLVFNPLGPFSRYVWTLPKSEVAKHDDHFVQFVVVFSAPATPAWAYPTLPFVAPLRVWW
jgi:hypothetical protein